MASSTHEHHLHHLPTPYGTTSAPPPTPSAHPNTTTSEVADLLSSPPLYPTHPFSPYQVAANQPPHLLLSSSLSDLKTIPSLEPPFRCKTTRFLPAHPTPNLLSACSISRVGISIPFQPIP
ncbi:hypothetical protein HAX54_031573 [Datura stramonium]|uniref:Uncharacterized protein n=1 Tax=Datura stramonium TaxID=4076 RepID=A0ABS8RL44_DATST|nr:hypothetical protein [Datura stramonium]